MTGSAGGRSVFPASLSQERIWLADQVQPGSPVHNIHCSVVLRVPHAVDVLDALRAVVSRHEALRTSVELSEGAVVQVVHAEVPVEAPVHDLRSAPDPQARATELAADLAVAAIPTERAPLWRACIARLDADTCLAILVVHHAVFDAASCVLLQRELTELCRARAAGGVLDLPALPVQYADYAVWQRGEMATPAARAGVEHWRARLAGLPAVHPVPTDRARPARLGYAGAEVRVPVPGDLAASVDRLAAERSVTAFTVLLAAYAAVLARHSALPEDTAEVVVGLTTTGRNRPELAGLIGMFVNQVVARIDVGSDPTFTDLLVRVRATVLEVVEHGHTPFQAVVDAVLTTRDPAVQPLHQLGFNYIPDSGIEPVPVTASRDDLEMDVSRREVRLRYRTELFERRTAEAIARRYVRLLEAAVADPERPVAELDLVDGAERAQLAAWNRTAGDYPAAATVHGLVARQVAATPDAVAVVAPGKGRGELTYRELDERADRVAQRLRGLGTRPGSLVGVCLPRSPELVVALLGVLKAGGAYVPLDPDYPAERLCTMLTDSEARIVITTGSLRPVLAGTAAVPLLADDLGEWPAAPADPPEDRARPDDPTYLIYTSGSTGRPKGVPNRHRGVVNRLDWMQRAYRLTPADAVLQKTPASFDVSVWEFFWPLITGARLVLARPGGHQDPAYLREVLAAERVTAVHFVPSMLAVFLDGLGPAEAAALRHLRLVVCSGEELPVATARACLDLLPGAELHNLYGPTEAAIDVTAWRCTRAGLAGAARVPLGTPIQNMRVHVLDRRGAPVPVGVPGELVIAGVGVAPGYHRRPELTAQRFVPDPDPGGEPHRGEGLAYRTGDLARWRADGLVEFLGRLDDQVKIRGVRVEPGEVAAVLRTRRGVRDAAAIIREDVQGEPRLVAFVTGRDLDPAELRRGLRESLPEHMVPTAVVALDALPLTPNGKLDRAALPAPALSGNTERPRVRPRTDLERLIARVWRDVLGIDDDQPLGIDEDFVDLGGHSLHAARVVAALRRTAPHLRRTGVLDLFAHPTVRELAAFAAAAPAGAPRPLLHELTAPAGHHEATYLCVPHGGASAVVFQPLADALPPGCRLLAVDVPGHDVGAAEQPWPFDELVARIGEDVLGRVEGPLVLYGHCSGSAVACGVARYLQARDRAVDAVCSGAYLPRAGRHSGLDGRRFRQVPVRDREQVLRGLGIEVGGLDGDDVARMLAVMRADARLAGDYFAALLAGGAGRIAAPVVAIVGSDDPLTSGYTERHREWAAVTTGAVALEVLHGAGHLFPRSRPEELAHILARLAPAGASAGRTAGSDGREDSCRTC